MRMHGHSKTARYRVGRTPDPGLLVLALRGLSLPLSRMLEEMTSGRLLLERAPAGQQLGKFTISLIEHEQGFEFPWAYGPPIDMKMDEVMGVR